MEYKNLTLSKLLTSSPILCELMKKVEELTKLNKIVLTQLNPQLSKYCRIHSYEAGILTLSSHSPVWGHTLRFAESELLSHLRTYPEWAGLKSIRSKVVAPPPNDPYENSISSTSLARLSPTPIITKKEAELLQNTATHIASESLRQALLKLAQRETSI